MLRLIETSFGVTVPNLTAWRRSVTGDFTGALNLTAAPVTAVPTLPATSLVGNATVIEEAVLNALTGTLDVGIDYPLPTSNVMPRRRPPPPARTSPNHARPAKSKDHNPSFRTDRCSASRLRRFHCPEAERGEAS